MILHRFRYKLFPTVEQEALFRRFAGVCRLVYSAALGPRRGWRRHYEWQTGRKLDYVAQARELTAARVEFGWIAVVSQTCQQQALRALDSAYASFFARRAGYLSPRRKGVNDASRFQGREIETKRLNARRSALCRPKIGWVRFRDTRPMSGHRLNASAQLDALGWHVSFACETSQRAPSETADLPGERLEAIKRRRRMPQRQASRRKRGSKRHAKALRRVAHLAARAACIRRDWQHKQTLAFANRFETLAVEALKTRNMAASAKETLDAPGRNVRQKVGLNRSILSQSWHAFEPMLAYELEERGGTLERINPAYTSQTCVACGCVDRESGKNQARFSCVGCANEDNADVNAARNILARLTESRLHWEGIAAVRRSDPVNCELEEIAQ